MPIRPGQRLASPPGEQVVAFLAPPAALKPGLPGSTVIGPTSYAGHLWDVIPNGTWIITCIAYGGGGGGCYSDGVNPGSGGGGGAYGTKVLNTGGALTRTPDPNSIDYFYDVGHAGVAGTVDLPPGGFGGVTDVYRGADFLVLLRIAGGGGAASPAIAGSGGQTSACVGDTLAGGGDGKSGAFGAGADDGKVFGGGGGGGGGGAGAGDTAGIPPSGGSPRGGAGATSTDTPPSADAGMSPGGGGGGGALVGSNPGAGGTGQLRITWDRVVKN